MTDYNDLTDALVASQDESQIVAFFERDMKDDAWLAIDEGVTVRDLIDTCQYMAEYNDLETCMINVRFVEMAPDELAELKGEYQGDEAQPQLGKHLELWLERHKEAADQWWRMVKQGWGLAKNLTLEEWVRSLKPARRDFAADDFIFFVGLHQAEGGSDG